MKKIRIAILAIVAIVAIIVACKKTPEVNLEYVDVERDLITVGTTTATIQCDYEYIATLKKAYLYYGEGEDATDMTSAEMRVVQNTLYVDLSGLKENTTYSYYYEFYNGFNSMKSAVKTFKTGTASNSVTLPTVVTAEVTEITTNSAKSGGEVTSDGGSEVTERGICWGTNENPTLNDNHIVVGAGTGTFTAMMNGLETSTTYYVRAYATNEKGTAYGLDREFMTVGGGGGGVPEGAINGLFSISPTEKVYFSKGNLQYQASTNTWRFAEHQWDFVGTQTPIGGEPSGTVTGSDNSLISSTYNGWIDLFGWGTSGWDHGAVCYQPWSTSTANSDYYAYGVYDYDLNSQTGQADWGYNAISNGSNLPNQWRTLSQHAYAQIEWDYIFNTRSTLSGIRYAKAVVNGVNGVILLPDNWTQAIHALNHANEDGAAFAVNEITATEWGFMESSGAVFLPAAGCREGTSVLDVAFNGCYWSSNHYYGSYNYACGVAFYDGSINPYYTKYGRYAGFSVRLVHLAE